MSDVSKEQVTNMVVIHSLECGNNVLVKKHNDYINGEQRAKPSKRRLLLWLE